MSFWPTTLEAFSTIAANVAVFVGAIYAGFKAIPNFSIAFKTLARQQLADVSNSEIAKGRADDSSASRTPGGVAELDDRRVAAVFALFERWKAVRPDLENGMGDFPSGQFTAGYRAFVRRMLGYFDLILQHVPPARADHWRDVLLGEMVKHGRILRSDYLSHDGEYGLPLRALIQDAIKLSH